MKLKFYFSAIVAALLLGSCAQNLETPEIDKMKTISASISNDTETRSTVEIDGDVANFLWAEGDAIVLLGEGNKIEATLVSGQGSAKGEFSYTGDYEPKAGDVAIYPYSSSHTTTSVNLPAEYNLGDNTNNTNALMYGVYTTNPDHLAFKQMAGVLRFDLKKLPAQTSKMVITADKGISGDFTIESGAVNAVVSDGTNNVVTINFDELTAEVESQLFYLPIPVGTYENIEVALYDENDLKTVATTVSTSTKEIARAQMIGFSFQPVDLPVKVGDRGYESIQVALGATTGDVTLSLGEGTYYIPETGLSGRNVVFEGASKEGTIVDMSVISGTPQYGAASVTFKNLTMKRKAEAYGGLTHSSAEKYDNCIIEGTLVTYAPLVEVKNSSFVPAANEYYNVHIYSTGTSTFENCTFETDACRAVYAHAESAVEMNILFDGCTFKSNTDAGKDFRWHQAIRLHTELGIYGTLSINNCSVNENGNFNPAYNGGLWVEWNNSTKILTKNFTKTINGTPYVDKSASVNGVEYATLEEAIAAAESGQTITLLFDTEVEQEIVIEAGKELTIDLNGNDINAPETTENHIYAIYNHGNLTIEGEGGSINSRGVYNYGTLTLNSGKISAIDGNGGYAVNNEEGSTFVMNGGWLAADYEDGDAPGAGFDATALDVPAGCTATLNAGKITNAGNWTFAISSAGTLNIPVTSTLTVEGRHGAIHVYGGETTVNAGTYSIPENEMYTDNVIYVEGGKMIINGGNFIADNDGPRGGTCVCDESGGVIINGGTFGNSSGGDVWGTTGTVIKGGTFENLTETQHIAEGYVLDGNQVVKGISTYADFLDAIQDDSKPLILIGNIALESDVTVPNTVKVPEGKTVELNLNGKTITATMHKNDGPVINNSGALTIKGGIISSTGNNGGAAIVNNGNLTVEDAELNGAPNADGSWPSYAFNNTGVATITNSKFTSYHGSISSYGDDATVTLNDCEIQMAGIPGFTNHGIYTFNGGAVVVNGGTYANNATDQGSTGGSVINGAVTVNSGTFTGRLENYYGTPVLNGGTYSVEPKAAFVGEGRTVVNNGDGTWTVN